MNLVLFFFNPVLAFISSFKNLRGQYAQIIFVSFYALFGYAISFELDTADFYRIGARFCQQTDLLDDIWGMYMAGELTDVYLVAIYSLLKPFTLNPKILFGTFGLIMGFWAYLCVNKLYGIWSGKHNRSFYLIVFYFFLNISVVNLTTVRFYTATCVFVYFAINYICYNRSSAIVGVVLTPLIHFGYLIGVASFLGFIVVKHIQIGTRTLYLLMTLTFVVSFANPQSLMDESDDVSITESAAINTKAKNYRRNATNTASSDAKRSGGSLYRQANNAFTTATSYIDKIGTFLLISFFYRKRKLIVQTKTESEVFRYVLFAAITSYASSFLIISGGRFMVLANMFFLLWIASVYQRNRRIGMDHRIKQLAFVKIYAVAFFLFNAPRFVTPLFWFAPPIFTIVDGYGFGAIDFK